MLNGSFLKLSTIAKLHNLDELELEVLRRNKHQSWPLLEYNGVEYAWYSSVEQDAFSRARAWPRMILGKMIVSYARKAKRFRSVRRYRLRTVYNIHYLRINQSTKNPVFYSTKNFHDDGIVMFATRKEVLEYINRNATVIQGKTSPFSLHEKEQRKRLVVHLSVGEMEYIKERLSDDIIGRTITSIFERVTSDGSKNPYTLRRFSDNPYIVAVWTGKSRWIVQARSLRQLCLAMKLSPMYVGEALSGKLYYIARKQDLRIALLPCPARTLKLSRGASLKAKYNKMIKDIDSIEPMDLARFTVEYNAVIQARE